MRSGNDAQERETAQWADVGIGPYGVRMEIADARCAPLRGFRKIADSRV